MSFIKCNRLWSLWLAQWNGTTPAQKEAFCSLVNGCVEENEIASGSGAPVGVPAVGQKIYVDLATGQIYYATATGTWVAVPSSSGFSGLALGSGGNVTFTGNGTAGSPLVGNVTFPPSSALTFGTGGNVTFTGNGTAGAPLVANTSTACSQVLASPVGFIAVAYGQDNAGGCVREAVTVAPTLCQEIAALPAGAIATVVGRDASGNCVTGTVSGGGSAATDGSAGIVALNTGNNLPSDATNATDALTASGLAAILQQAGGNALTSAVCAATANCGGGSSGPCIGIVTLSNTGLLEIRAAANTTATVTVERAVAPLVQVLPVALDANGYGSVQTPDPSTDPNLTRISASHPSCFLTSLSNSFVAYAPAGVGVGVGVGVNDVFGVGS